MIIQILGPWFCNKPFVLHSLDFQLHQFVSIPPDLHSKSMPTYIYVIFTPSYKTDVEVRTFRLHIQYHTISMTSKKPMAFSQPDSPKRNHPGWAPNAIIAGHGNSAIVHAWSEWSYLPCLMTLTLEVQPTIKIISSPEFWVIKHFLLKNWLPTIKEQRCPFFPVKQEHSHSKTTPSL